MPEDITQALEAAEDRLSSAVRTIIAVAGLQEGKRITYAMLEDALALEHHRRHGGLQAEH